MNKVVFTNGCFDILHAGHIDLLEHARSLGSKLIVGINSDKSVKAIKGEGRPVQGEDERKAILLGLKSVDEVVVFNELTPESIIKHIRPDVLVKGGDWKPNEIIGADFVESYGGKVVSLPLKDGFSSSKIVDSIRNVTTDSDPATDPVVERSLKQHIEVLQLTLDSNARCIETTADLIRQTLENGNKILLCGNGGSAADAQHIAAELTGRYETDRKALPAIALTTDTSALTALANDLGFESVFARQIEALAAEGDCLIAISTSGTSPSIISAVMAARNRGCSILGMTGANGKKLASLCDACIIVPSERTARIQEAHITIAHIWCEIIDAHFSSPS